MTPPKDKDQVLRQCLGMGCSNLVWDDLATLQVQVDKKNLIEFSFIHVHYLYNYYMTYAPISYDHMTF